MNDLALAIALFSISAAVAAVGPDAFDYRGIKLGITLGEFRKATPASKERQISENHRLANFDIIPACTGDDKSKEYPINMRVLPRKEASDSGGSSCVWVYLKAQDGPSRYAVATVPLGDFSVDNYRIDFIKKPGDPEPILFRIEIRVPYTAYPVISVGLADRFGKPSTRTDVLQNKMGAKFDSLVSIWSNSVSTIELNQRFYEVEQGIVRYELTDYANYANSVAEKHLHESSKM